jgi:hypothetical protein
MRTRAALSVCGGALSLGLVLTARAGAAVEIVTERAAVAKPMRIVGSVSSRVVLIVVDGG